MFWSPSPDLFLNTLLSLSFTDNSLDLMACFCSDMHCQLWDLIQTGVYLSNPCPIK
jgi:hypothetical protein